MRGEVIIQLREVDNVLSAASGMYTDAARDRLRVLLEADADNQKEFFNLSLATRTDAI